MRLKQNDVKRIPFTYLVKGVATTWTGKTFYCKVGGNDRVACTAYDQGTYLGQGYFTANGTTATGTKETFPLEWSVVISATSEDYVIQNVPDELRELVVE